MVLPMGTRYANMTGDGENYTPKGVVDCVRSLFGKIDFDPCSSALANEVVKADRYMDRLANGLTSPWPSHSNIFINPPYHRDTIEAWADQVLFAQRYGDSNIIWLSNNSTETKAVQKILRNSLCHCLPSSRMTFFNPAKPDRKSKAMQGQVIVLLASKRVNSYHLSKSMWSGSFFTKFSGLGECFLNMRPYNAAST